MPRPISSLTLALVGTLAFAGAPAQAQLREENPPTEAGSPAPAKPDPTVVLYEDARLIDKFHSPPAQVRAALDASILSLAGKSSQAEAWKQWVKPEDKVAIKINTVGGPLLSSHLGLVESVYHGLRAAGVPEGNIQIWDKFAVQMRNAGWDTASPPNGWNVRSVIPGRGFDPGSFYFSEIVGMLIWGDQEFVGKQDPLGSALNMKDWETPGEETLEREKTDAANKQISNRSYFTKIVTKECTKIVNIAVMSDHPELGVYGCVSSLILGSIDNNRRFLSDSQTSSLALAELIARPELGQKTVLHIMDGRIAQFAGGPRFVPLYTRQPGRIYVSRDPVAIDTLARQDIVRWREEARVAIVDDSDEYLDVACQFGVGESDPQKIPVRRLGPAQK
jgi:hypothetical protein